MTDRPEVEITSREQWRAWLAEHHATSDGVWLVTWKKAAGDRHVPYEDLVLEALCFGWIDSRRRRVDDERSTITMTPRRPGSRWMQRNRDRVVRLEAEGLMTDAGRAAIEAAKASGAFDELRPVEALEEPDDLRAALDEDSARRERWDASTRSARFQALLHLHDAKRPETRARRIAGILADL